MKKDKIYTVLAFCKDGNGGNLAGVSLSGDDYSRQEKQEEAARLGFSETVFVQISKVADYRLEYFTPVAEVPLCGHATIATFVLMQKKGLVRPGNYSIETLAGVMKIVIEKDGTVMMEQSKPVFYDKYIPSDFDCCLQSQWIDTRFPIQVVSTGLRDVFVPIDTAEHLDTLQPNFAEMIKLNTKQDVVSVHAFSIVDETERIAVCRNFAPRYDIDEESATGTSNCALACYLHRYYSKRTKYVFEQGLSMGKPSRIEVQLIVNNDEIDEVMVGGKGLVLD